MSYTLITSHDAAAYTSRREGNPIRYIVIHHWDDPAKNPTFNGTIAWFENPNAGTSAHYVVEAGRVACLVDESDTAYHAGSWLMNCQSIGIECNPRCSSEDLATVRELVCELLERYPGAQVIGHQDVISTSCPGRYYAHLDYLRGGAPAPAPARSGIAVDGIAGEETITALQRLLGTPADGVISSQYAPNAEFYPAFTSVEWVDDAQGSTMVAALQKRLGVESDGILGRHTARALQKRLGVSIDGYVGAQTVTALQNAINRKAL